MGHTRYWFHSLCICAASYRKVSRDAISGSVGSLVVNEFMDPMHEMGDHAPACIAYALLEQKAATLSHVMPGWFMAVLIFYISNLRFTASVNSFVADCLASSELWENQSDDRLEQGFCKLSWESVLVSVSL